ncbi:MAG TPA: hypothetical protein DCF46_03850, partial [Porphyromonadaceae bacterium]|nr:hypothetical protein [Porphyromonadaceae bacterium]
REYRISLVFQVNPESILQLRVLSGQSDAEKQEKGDAGQFHSISINGGGTNIRIFWISSSVKFPR